MTLFKFKDYVYGITCLILVVFFTSCSLMKGPSPPPRYYVLSGSRDNKVFSKIKRLSQRDSIEIIVGPVEIPSYLDRNEIVTRLSKDELNVSTTNLWAEPLDVGIERTLALELYQLSEGRIITYPFSQNTSMEAGVKGYRLLVNFYNFECTIDGLCILRGSWNLMDAKTGRSLMERRFFISKNFPEGPDSYQKVVFGMNALLFTLSTQIKKEVLERLDN